MSKRPSLLLAARSQPACVTLISISTCEMADDHIIALSHVRRSGAGAAQDMDTVTVTCASHPVASHARCWDQRRTLTDPAHVATARTVRAAHQDAVRVDARVVGEDLGLRPLSIYDDLFDLPGIGQASTSGAVA